MTLLAGTSLNATRFFKPGRLIEHGSSVDLTIGTIFDDVGRKVDGLFTLEPGHMVQVCSAEIFSLPPDVTAHVTYKTTLTRRGVWALTVGIVDPGWEAPISTTLLNFSKVPYSLKAGDPFLRASFFQHDPVEPKHLRESPDPDEYRTSVQKDAAMLFPKTFLDRDAIAKSAGDAVLKKVRDEAFAWVAGIALLFALIQIAAGYLQPAYNAKPSEYDLNILQKELTTLRDKVKELESPTVRKDQTP